MTSLVSIISALISPKTHLNSSQPPNRSTSWTSSITSLPNNSTKQCLTTLIWTTFSGEWLKQTRRLSNNQLKTICLASSTRSSSLKISDNLNNSSSRLVHPLTLMCLSNNLHSSQWCSSNSQWRRTIRRRTSISMPSEPTSNSRRWWCNNSNNQLNNSLNNRRRSTSSAENSLRECVHIISKIF